MGKHGNLEWLPGKALALSEECWPEAALGALPHLYPFIVNDPGEGAQAKRRSAAVIVDHLTPPLTRAESYGRCAISSSWSTNITKLPASIRAAAACCATASSNWRPRPASTRTAA